MHTAFPSTRPSLVERLLSGQERDLRGRKGGHAAGVELGDAVMCRWCGRERCGRAP